MQIRRWASKAVGAVWVPAVLLHLAVGLFQLDRRDLNSDEAFSLAATHNLWTTVVQTKGTMAAYYAALTPWARLSHSAQWLGLPSLLASAVAVAFLGLIVERQVDTRTGRWAAVFAAVSFPIVRFSVVTRSYSLWLMVAAIAWYALDRALADAEDRRARQIFAACVLLLPVVHGLSGIGIVGFAAAIAWARPSRRHALRLLAPCAAALVIIAALYQWGAREVGSVRETISPALLRLFIKGLVYPGLKPALVLVVVAGFGAWRLARAGGGTPLERFRQVALPIWGLGSPLVLLAISTVRPSQTYRYALPAALGIAGLLAVAVVRPAGWRVRWVVPAALFVALFLGQLELLGVSHEWRSATAAISQQQRPGDRIVFVPASTRLTFEAALDDQQLLLMPPLAGTGTPLGTFDRFGTDDDMALTESQVLEASRIWIVTNLEDHQGADEAFISRPAIEDGFSVVGRWQVNETAIWLLENNAPG